MSNLFRSAFPSVASRNQVRRPFFSFLFFFGETDTEGAVVWCCGADPVSAARAVAPAAAQLACSRPLYGPGHARARVLYGRVRDGTVAPARLRLLSGRGGQRGACLVLSFLEKI